MAMPMTEGDWDFAFPAGCRVSRPERWTFYRQHFQNTAGGSKTVDFIVLGRHECWLLESTDYRRPQTVRPADLPLEIAQKMRDTLALLAAAAAQANNAEELRFAKGTLARRRWRVALHIEFNVRPSKLFPATVDLADIRQKLRQKSGVRGIDPHPVVHMSNSRANVPWTVTQSSLA